MIQLAFLVLWTLVMAGVAVVTMLRMQHHVKVYVMFLYSYVYLSVIFYVFPKLPGAFGS